MSEATTEFIMARCEKTLSNSGIVSNDIKMLFVSAWDKYSQKYNSLAEKMEEKGIDGNLLDEVIKLKNELTKINIAMKIDNLFKI